MSPPWAQAAPAAIAIDTKMTSPSSFSEAPAFVARAVWASMHQGHCVMFAMPTAISSFVLASSAPGANA